jgi:adenylylsulfate reductase subunit A
MVRYATDFADFTPTLKQSNQELVDLVYKPVRTFLDNCDYTTAIDINPNYIKPNGMMYRLMKATHEYGAGTATFYQTSFQVSGSRHGSAGHHARRLRKMAAGDLHELMRCLGNRTPHLDGGSSPASHSVPQRDPLSGLLLSGGLPGPG